MQRERRDVKADDGPHWVVICGASIHQVAKLPKVALENNRVNTAAVAPVGAVGCGIGPEEGGRSPKYYITWD